MRAQRAVFLGALGVAVITALACNALNGSGDLTIDDGADAAPTSTATGTTPPPPVTPPPEGDGGVPPPPPPPPPTCACAPAPPSGWTGPVAFVEANGSGAACPSGLVSVLDAGTAPTAPSDCTACTCGSPTGACATMRVAMYNNATNCTGGTCKPTRSVAPNCGSFDSCLNTTSIAALGEPNVVQGCPPDGGAVVPAKWGKTAAACAFVTPLSGNCPADQVCAPKSAGAATAKTCIVHDGTTECPDAGYTTALAYSTHIDDTRSCAPCVCGGPNASCSGGVTSFFSDPQCMVKITDLPGNTCQMTNIGNAPYAKVTAAPVLDGGCSPLGGGLAGGTLGESGPATICCLP